jgi:uncharacterized protein
MTSKMIWANLAVSDLEQTTNFYTKLGFKLNGKPSDELTSIAFGDSHFVINFFLRDAVHEKWPFTIVDSQSANEIMFTLSAHSREEVDSAAKEITAAGGTIVSHPASFGNDYYGFAFADPDGHKFNVFFMKGL